MGHWGTCPPLDFKLFNFSGHFIAAQSMTFDLHVVAYPVKQYTDGLQCESKNPP